jgi:hypothetical protein
VYCSVRPVFAGADKRIIRTQSGRLERKRRGT